MKKMILVTLATVMFYNQVGYAIGSNTDKKTVQNVEQSDVANQKISDIAKIAGMNISYQEKQELTKSLIEHLSDDELIAVLKAINERNDEVKLQLNRLEKNPTIESIKVIKWMAGTTTLISMIVTGVNYLNLLESDVPTVNRAYSARLVRGFGSILPVAGTTYLLASYQLEENLKKLDLNGIDANDLEHEIENLRILSTQVSAQLTAQITELHAKKLAQ